MKRGGRDEQEEDEEWELEEEEGKRSWVYILTEGRNDPGRGGVGNGQEGKEHMSTIRKETGQSARGRKD